jgi:hypothetical protein
MTEMYIEPPQLTIAIYSNEPEATTFSRVCDVLPSLGCTLDGRVEVAPADQDFELLSDLGSLREVLAPRPTELADLIAGRATGRRALRTSFSHPKFGNAIVEYQQRTGVGRHPIGVSVGSGSLGIPDTLWTSSQRRSAYSLADWSRSVLASITTEPSVKYGAIGVEFSLPTPDQLQSRKPRLVTELFIARRLLVDESLEARLRASFSSGEVSDWTDGLFCSGWAPFNARRATIGDFEAAGSEILKVLRIALRIQE